MELSCGIILKLGHWPMRICRFFLFLALMAIFLRALPCPNDVSRQVWYNSTHSLVGGHN